MKQKIECPFFILGSDFYKFIIVGASNTFISFFVFYFLYGTIGVSVFNSQIVSYSAGIVWSFILNRFWTFKSKRDVVKSAFLFVMVQCFLMFFSAYLISNIIKLYDYSAVSVWIFVMALVTVMNFLISKYLVFLK